MILECSDSVECLNGTVSIGPVAAGVNYSCSVTAENSVGGDEMRTDYLVVITG